MPPLNGEVPFIRRLKKTTVVSIIGKAKVRTAEIILLSAGSMVFEEVPFQRNKILNAARKAPRNCVPVSPIYILDGCQLKNKKARIEEEVPSIRMKNTVVIDFSIRISEIMVDRAASTTIDAMASMLSRRLIAFISPTTHIIVTK